MRLFGRNLNVHVLLNSMIPLSPQKMQQIDEEHLKSIIGHLEEYITAQTLGQRLVDQVSLTRQLPGVNSIKKYKCTLQVGPLFLQIHTNLNPLKVFTSSC